MIFIFLEIFFHAGNGIVENVEDNFFRFALSL